jgi:hypothetical protein
MAFTLQLAYQNNKLNEINGLLHSGKASPGQPVKYADSAAKHRLISSHPR